MFSKWIKKIEALKYSSYKYSTFSTSLKNEILQAIKDLLVENKQKIFSANQKDVRLAQKNGISDVLVERLTLNDKRLDEMVAGVEKVISLSDPANVVLEEWVARDGLMLQKVRVPLGVIFMIYESRPNVTIDSAVLCLKSGNCVILRGGKEAINTNKVLVSILNTAIKSVLTKNRITEFSEVVLFVDDPSYKLAEFLLKQESYIDLVIPRGGEKMVKNIKSKSLIPVLSHGSGNCHSYVDVSANIDIALKVCLNAKVQRPSVCNATEKLLVHKGIAEKFLPQMAKLFVENKVEIRGCPATKKLLSKEGIRVISANEADWYKEYLDLIIAIKIVNNVEEAIEHINKYGSHHSEAIIAEDKDAQKKFVNEVDSSAVFINSSTRLHDGGVFGFGTEIGISTSKLHARGTMGLKELTTTKYVAVGSGHTRT